ncbi:MAG: tetratricopeptide (TPR) repeat protein, partial [Woeseiaceae bacterium]
NRHEKVHGQALEMIRADVSDPVPYFLLASIAAEHGNHIKACELFGRAADLQPQNAGFQAYYGKALTTLGHQNRARAAADKAAALPVEDAFLADTIGVIYSRTGFHEEAVPFFKKALAINKAPANFHYNLAASLQFLGKFDQAKTAYLETLRRDPKSYRAWSSLVALKRQTENDHHLDALKALFDELSDDADATLHLGHAIAKTLEDFGRYEESLEWLHAAKRLKRSTSGINSIPYEELFTAAKATAPAAPQCSDGDIAAAPIFIIGLPRTGTTMVDRILSSHTQVTSAGELNIFPGLVKEATRTRSNMVMDRETLAKANDLDLEEIGRAYIASAKDLARGAARFTDKMPLNFFYAGLIHRALPNAHIVAVRRGAMDSCLSNYRQLLTVQDSYYRYTYDLEDTAAFYRQFDDLMNNLRTHLPADRFLEIHYENIVHDQEQQTRRLLDFCGLDWEEACLRFHENTAPVSTASSVQVRRPLYSDSIDRWKRYGNKLDVLKQALGDLADAEKETE